LAQWNHAADYAVNNMLDGYVQEEKAVYEKQHGVGRFPLPWSLPEGGLIDHTYDDLSSEEIYDRLPDGSGSPQANQQAADGSSGNQSSPSKPSCGEFTTEPGDAEESAEAEREWKVAVVQAATVARMRGTLPASLQRLVGELLEPKVPWRQVLREFIRQFARDDYSFRRPSRRYSGSGVILPSLYSERMGRLVIAVDTSGSITDHVLAEFQAEVQAALDECQPESIEVVYCDAAVNGTEEYYPGDTVRLTPKGGGGTAFGPVFEHVDQGEPPVACIYLTDGWGSFPESEPEYPVLWASTDRDEFPFGQVVVVR
jgi:predicted metal-dependent peptidase